MFIYVFFNFHSMENIYANIHTYMQRPKVCVRNLWIFISLLNGKSLFRYLIKCAWIFLWKKKIYVYNRRKQHDHFFSLPYGSLLILFHLLSKSHNLPPKAKLWLSTKALLFVLWNLVFKFLLFSSEFPKCYMKNILYVCLSVCSFGRSVVCPKYSLTRILNIFLLDFFFAFEN